MKCEYCGKDHDGSYGSGRFCAAECARGFSTKAKRKEINEKVSNKLRKSPLKQSVKRQIKKSIAKSTICPACGKTKSEASALCRDCAKAAQRTKRDQRLLSDFVKMERPPAIRYNKIRGFAREQLADITVCELCGFSFGTCVHHIKNIADFSLDTPLAIVNARSNLIKLCPNHHIMAHKELIDLKTLIDIASTH